jgi:hypothetical protein
MPGGAATMPACAPSHVPRPLRSCRWRSCPLAAEAWPPGVQAAMWQRRLLSCTTSVTGGRTKGAAAAGAGRALRRQLRSRVAGGAGGSPHRPRRRAGLQSVRVCNKVAWLCCQPLLAAGVARTTGLSIMASLASCSRTGGAADRTSVSNARSVVCASRPVARSRPRPGTGRPAHHGRTRLLAVRRCCHRGSSQAASMRAQGPPGHQVGAGRGREAACAPHAGTRIATPGGRGAPPCPGARSRHRVNTWPAADASCTTHARLLGAGRRPACFGGGGCPPGAVASQPQRAHPPPPPAPPAHPHARLAAAAPPTRTRRTLTSARRSSTRSRRWTRAAQRCRLRACPRGWSRSPGT